MTQDEAMEQAYKPLRTFMLKQTREKDLALFVAISKSDRPRSAEDVPISVLTPAYVISELKTAFQIGLCSISGNRYGCGQYTNVYGYVYASPGNDISSVQASPFRDGRRLVSSCEVPGGKLLKRRLVGNK